MTKINYIILEYQDTLSHTDITPDTKSPKAVLRRFVRLFRTVDDSRIDSMTD